MRRTATTRVLVALAVVGVGAIHASRGKVGPVEKRAFSVVNQLPDGLFLPGWVAMQAGSFGAVAVSAIAALVAGRRDAAVRFGVAGGSVWLGAKGMKRFVGRGRPADHLGDVQLRGSRQSGLGYPSGHAAVAMALGVVAARSWPEKAPPLLAGATVVGLIRIYVGAHLPTDVIGGAALGLAAGTIVNDSLPQ